MTVSEPSEVQGDSAMADRINDGGPAFPFDYGVPETEDHPGYQASHPGMSLRDYFAAKAMHAELNTAGQHKAAAIALKAAAEQAGQTIEQRIAFNAYALADAMIAARISTRKDERA